MVCVARNTFRWSRSVGSANDDYALEVSVSPDGNYVYITGHTRGDIDDITKNGNTDIFIAKYDANGNKLWVKLLGTEADDYGAGITISPNGDFIYITGDTAGNLGGSSNKGGPDIFIAKYDANGNVIWVKLLGTGNEDIASNITLYSNSAYITGHTLVIWMATLIPEVATLLYIKNPLPHK